MDIIVVGPDDEKRKEIEGQISLHPELNGKVAVCDMTPTSHGNVFQRCPEFFQCIKPYENYGFPVVESARPRQSDHLGGHKKLKGWQKVNRKGKRK